MTQTYSSDTERKIIAILKVLNEATEPLGSITIARELERHGISLSERAVRYHLLITDERGYTQPLGRDGRMLTPTGLEELKIALAPEHVGFVLEKLEMLAFRTTFDPIKKTGMVPINTSLVSKERFQETLTILRKVYGAGFGAGQLIGIAHEGEKLGSVVIPSGKTGIATVCSVVINGVLLKSGVPIESRFGGVMELRSPRPERFIAIIYYGGTSLDPSEQYIRARMTTALQAAETGNGRILANFREIPSPSRAQVSDIIEHLKEAGINAIYKLGNNSEPVCQIPVDLNHVGLVLIGGLNPLAAAVEAGIEIENAGESGLIEYSKLVRYNEV